MWKGQRNTFKQVNIIVLLVLKPLKCGAWFWFDAAELEAGVLVDMQANEKMNSPVKRSFLGHQPTEIIEQ